MSDVLTFSPDVLRVNRSLDSDAARKMCEFVQRAADAGRPVVVSSVERTYSVSEAARLLGVSASTVQRSIADGSLEAVRRGGYWRVAESQIDRFRDLRCDRLAKLVADELDF